MPGEDIVCLKRSPLRWPFHSLDVARKVAGRRKGPATAAVAQRSPVHRLWSERGATAPRPESPCWIGASNGYNSPVGMWGAS